MNHVNAIRYNDEYQCSHCGKSWDIHEEAPDCKMTLIGTDVHKTVNYFGLSLTVPLFAKYISTDRDGEVWCFNEEPELCDEFWDSRLYGTPKVRVATVNLHGLDWTETLREC